MPIPTEPVGSLPRPSHLQKTIAAYDAGTASLADLRAAQEKATSESFHLMQSTGQTIVCDGEQRKSSFATYPIIDTLGGAGLADNFAPDGQYFAIFDDGHDRRLPRIIRGPMKYRTYSFQDLEESRDIIAQTLKRDTKVKQAVIAPSMLYLLYPLEGTCALPLHLAGQCPAFTSERFWGATTP